MLDGMTRTSRSATAVVRARHRARLRDLRAWALARGRPCDLDIAASVLDELAHRFGHDPPVLTRADVNQLISTDLWNRASLAGEPLPDDLMEHVWTVLVFLHDEGGLDGSSDPRAALLEPLQCYGGLDAEGRPRAEGVDIDFPCQCWFPWDPGMPEGQGSITVGLDADSMAEFVCRAHLPLRRDEPTVSTFEPLRRLAHRAGGLEPPPPLHEAYRFLGRVDPGPGHPTLRVFAPNERSPWPPLCVDDDGFVWRPVPDRRRRLGYRWKRFRPGLGLVGPGRPAGDLGRFVGGLDGEGLGADLDDGAPA